MLANKPSVGSEYFLRLARCLWHLCCIIHPLAKSAKPKPSLIRVELLLQIMDEGFGEARRKKIVSAYLMSHWERAAEIVNQSMHKRRNSMKRESAPAPSIQTATPTVP